MTRTDRTVRVVGVGMGPQHVTPEAAAALRASAYVVAARKGEGDPLLAVRRELCAIHGLDLVEVDDPPRDRAPDGQAAYDTAVVDWHDARAEAWGAQIASRTGDPAFLVWGDPALYDSTIRVVDRLAARLDLAVEVIAGVAAPHLLAARHGIVLHEVGRPVHVTTQRRQDEAVAAGQRNIVVMLTAGVRVDGLDDWAIWWGANLGTASEELVAGRVGEVRAELEEARARAEAAAGFVMDCYLLRAPEDLP